MAIRREQGGTKAFSIPKSQIKRQQPLNSFLTSGWYTGFSIIEEVMPIPDLTGTV
jgi:hypothetical protein